MTKGGIRNPFLGSKERMSGTLHRWLHTPCFYPTLAGFWRSNFAPGQGHARRASPDRKWVPAASIDHSKTKARHPQSNGICERFHKTLLQEFYQVAFRKKIYHTLDELQADLDTWLKEYNESRPHSGKYCFGKTPMQTFLGSLPLARGKMLNQTVQTIAATA